MQKWEYKVITIKRIINHGFAKITVEWDPKVDLENELKHLGENGWELVSIVPIADLYGNSSGLTHELRYVFKRPK